MHSLFAQHCPLHCANRFPNLGNPGSFPEPPQLAQNTSRNHPKSIFCKDPPFCCWGKMLVCMMTNDLTFSNNKFISQIPGVSKPTYLPSILPSIPSPSLRLSGSSRKAKAAASFAMAKFWLESSCGPTSRVERNRDQWSPDIGSCERVEV